MPKRQVPLIRGQGIQLRLLEPNDLPMTLSWRNLAENRRWFVHSEPIGWDRHVSWFQQYQERDDDFLFVAEETSSTPHAIGQASLYHIDWSAGSAEFGRLLIGEVAARGRTLGFEITRSLLDFGFGPWELGRVHLEVFADNTRAIGVYRRCGFQPVAQRENLVLMEVTHQGWNSSEARYAGLGWPADPSHRRS